MNSSMKTPSGSGREGFTLVEVMMASAISMLVMTMTIGFFISTSRYWREIIASTDASNEADMALSCLVYGRYGQHGLRNAVADSFNMEQGGNGWWSISYTTASQPDQTNTLSYLKDEETLNFQPLDQNVGKGIKKCIVTRVPSAGNPMGLRIRATIDSKYGGVNAQRESETTVYFRN